MTAGKPREYRAGQAERIVAFSPQDLRLASACLQELLKAPALDLEQLALVRLPSALPGEVVAAVPAQVLAGQHLERLAQDQCRAQRYGYVCLVEDRLSLASPLWVDPEGLIAYWLLLEERACRVTQEMLAPWLEELGVVEGVDEEAIGRTLEQVRQGRHQAGAVPIARGQAPLDGQDACLELLVEVERRAGQARGDGSMDFRQVNFAPEVKAGQVLARCHPPTPGTPGRSVRGQVLSPKPVQDSLPDVGENVEVRAENNVRVYVAKAAGTPVVKEAEIAVSRLLRIDGDVDFHTGNLDFDGALFIAGSVLAGFSIRATGDVSIAGAVEPGAQVEAGGDVAIGQGVAGRRTRISAGGQVRAQFVQEATVQAQENIELGRFAYQARLRAGGWVRVAGGDERSGVVGGQVWVGKAMDLSLAGSPAHVATQLMAGVDPESAHKLDRLKEATDLTYGQLRRLLECFGAARLDVEQIKNRLAAATGPNRKLLARAAQRLGQVAQAHRQLLAARRHLEEKISAQVSQAQVRVRERVFTGVEVRIGQHTFIVAEDRGPTCFRVAGGRLVAR
jgi:uncharacterized protein (DUF342 family)